MALVWTTDSSVGWALGGVVAGLGSASVTVRLEKTGEEVVRKAEEVIEAHQSAPGELKGVADLTKLPALHEPALLQALHERFAADLIYTNVGQICIAVNPFKRIPGLYDAGQSKKWVDRQRDLPPHVYGVADAAYRAMVDDSGCNQSILVSGESGAGKTETTKISMAYLTDVSGGGGAEVSNRILQANPLLEAFGNAKTVRNDNSSRFGKLIELRFAPEGRHKLLGAGVTTYLLEKARVVGQSRGERNYHIFYELFAGATGSQSSAWQLPSKGPAACRYTGVSGEFARSDVDDAEQFKKTCAAMTTLGFTQSDMDQVFAVVAGVLHLGDVEFEAKDEGCAVQGTKGLHAAASLLGIAPGVTSNKSFTAPERTLADVLCVRRISINNGRSSNGGGENASGNDEETYIKLLSPQQAREARDALAMSLYERLFGWIVWRVNRSMEWHEQPISNIAKGAEKLRRQFHIGVLDIFGFEVFEYNFFEQLCINYANEQLQRQFNEHVFELEQKMYELEGVDWTFVEFPDNSPTISMIEAKPIGLLSLIDEECMYPSGSDKSLAGKLYQNLPQRSDRFQAPSLQQRDYQFTVRHFAGDVTYSIEGFYRKNKNELRQDAVDLICSSAHPLVGLLLPADANEAAGGADMASYFDKRAKDVGEAAMLHPGSAPPRLQPASSSSLSSLSDSPSPTHIPGRRSRSRSALQQTTVSSHFKTQLSMALTGIRASRPHYVRCLKPNDQNRAGVFSRPRVLAQLRYSGVVEVIRVARAGYPTRFELADFVERYGVLLHLDSKRVGVVAARQVVQAGKDVPAAAKSICVGAGLKSGPDFQAGKTRVFLRAEAHAALERAKGEKVIWAVVKIQRLWLRWSRKHRYSRACRRIQRNVRGYLARKSVVPLLRARRKAAQRIHSSPNFQRWLADIRETLAIRAELELGADDEEDDDRKRLWLWFVAPLAVMAGVPALVRRLYAASPAILALLIIMVIGMLAGSLLVLDGQRRGVVRMGHTPRRRASSAKAFMHAKMKQQQQQQRQQPNKLSQLKRFGGPRAPPPPKIEISVNADAVKRFAGLAAARSEAMKRAKLRAEEMLRNGELVTPAKTGGAALATLATPASATSSTAPTPTPPKSTATSSTISPAMSMSLAGAAVPTPAKKTPPAPPARGKGIQFAENIERRESVGLNQDEEDALNKAILTMFLEDQAPDKVDKADDLLDKFQGNVDALFDNLSSGNDIEALMASEDTNTPAWNRFAAMRKQRQSAKGFFGTGSASPLAFVHEEHVKSRSSVSKKKRGSDTEGKQGGGLGGLMSRVMSIKPPKGN